MELENGLSIQIFINDISVPLGPAVLLDFLHMSCSTQVGVPTIHFAMIDIAGWVPGYCSLRDGSTIRVQEASNEKDQIHTRNFRLSSVKQENVTNGIMYSVDGYFDIPLYWLGSSDQSIRGTSFQALKDIASRCNLKFDGVSTSDSHVWTSNNVPYHSWARSIAEQGYRNASSCMQLGVDLDYGMLYRDIEEKSDSQFTFALGTYARGENSYAAISHRPIMRSGALNAFSGYNDVLIEQDPFKEQQLTVHDNVQLGSVEEGKIQVNPSLHSKISRGRVVFSPINPGNVPTASIRAKYQNRRVTNMYSSGLEVLTNQGTNIKLMDSGSVIANLTENPAAKQFVGTYRVVTRIIYIKGMQRLEKFLLARKTINERSVDAEVYSTNQPLQTTEPI